MSPILQLIFCDVITVRKMPEKFAKESHLQVVVGLNQVVLGPSREPRRPQPLLQEVDPKLQVEVFLPELPDSVVDLSNASAPAAAGAAAETARTAQRQ